MNEIQETLLNINSFAALYAELAFEIKTQGEYLSSPRVSAIAEQIKKKFGSFDPDFIKKDLLSVYGKPDTNGSLIFLKDKEGYYWSDSIEFDGELKKFADADMPSSMISEYIRDIEIHGGYKKDPLMTAHLWLQMKGEELELNGTIFRDVGYIEADNGYGIDCGVVSPLRGAYFLTDAQKMLDFIEYWDKRDECGNIVV